MNKTVNINIGGLFFHIDEDAYQKLARYFDAIKRSLSNSNGKDEIMKDIEMRVAEIFSESQKSDKHVINLQDVDQVVTVMGQPEDYRIEEEENEAKSFSNATNFKSRRLFRDKDRGTIAGVCTGLSYYFGIEAIWVKLLFVLFTIAFFGTGILAYFILWLIIPKAITTADKIAMTGETVNISSIEKKVKEEFDNVSSKLKNADYDKIGNQIKSTGESAGNKIGDILVSIFGAFAKVLGAIILVFASMALLAVTIGSIILMFSSSLPDNTVFNHFSTPLGFDTPMWIQGLLFLLAIGIPLFFFLILGLKLLITQAKSISNVAKYSLLGIWIFAISALVFLGLKEANQLAIESKSVKKEIINLKSTDTLFVKFKTNDYFSKDINEIENYRMVTDDKNQKLIYSNLISIKLMPTDEKIGYLQIEKISFGKSPKEANDRAEKIKYNIKIENNKLILDNYFLTEISSKSKKQNVQLFLYLPKDTLLKMDKSVQNFDESENNYFNLHHSSDDYIYKVNQSQINCLNCPSNENEFNDIEFNNSENDTIISDEKNSKIIVNDDGILIKTTDQKTKQIEENSIKSIKLDENGLEIKTK